jgi:hypothetical protein
MYKNIYVRRSFEGALDTLGNVENAVYTFSPYKRLTKRYRGELVKVQRTGDFASKWFGYDRYGDVEKGEILSWVGAGNDGLVEEVTNPYDNNYNTIQTTISYKPKIVVSGVFQENGLLFDGVNDTMNASEYSAMNITSPPVSIYADCVYSNKSQTPLMKGTDIITACQFGIYYYSIPERTHFAMDGDFKKFDNGVVSGNFKTLYGHNNNIVKGYNNNGYYEIAKIKSSYTSYNNLTIGGNGSYYFSGNIRVGIAFNSDEINLSNYNTLKNIF